VAPWEVRPPTSLVEGDKPLVYTIRELNQQTSRVLNEIKRSERPGLITRYGRLDFMIVPLRPEEIESRVLTEMAREIEKQRQD
jgi:hypothetical protein